ncbi:MAG: hypothetical protein LUC16_01705 [Coprobacillus sp.]|nr:hypothetical protein [Coprobacillus sp.]
MPLNEKSNLEEEQIKALYEALNRSNYAVVISGAGISIAAGGVTYSGMAGRLGWGARDLMSGNPTKMYEAYYKSFLGSMFEHGPTEAHKAIAELEKMGHVGGVITTNVDCMHTMAGSTNVAEIEGSFQINVCQSCHERTYGYEIWRNGEMPRCDMCGGLLLPYNMYAHASVLDSELRRAQQMIAKADLIIIIGANGCYTHLYWNYQKRGTKIIQINPSRTYFDQVADINIHLEADPVFIKLMEMFKENPSLS